MRTTYRRTETYDSLQPNAMTITCNKEDEDVHAVTYTFVKFTFCKWLGSNLFVVMRHPLRVFFPQRAG